jgi:hypothetical protein
MSVMLNGNYIEFKCFKFKIKLCIVGRVIAQVDSYRLLPTAARVQSQVSLYGIYFFFFADKVPLRLVSSKLLRVPANCHSTNECLV